MRNTIAYLTSIAFFLGFQPAVRADIIISTGYDDGYGNGTVGTPPIPPNPWYGSANTTFFGSASDLSAAPASDPDISGVLLHNTGSTAVTVQDASITAF